jgi:drug/metabolite transporter (DMT)-like permease
LTALSRSAAAFYRQPVLLLTMAALFWAGNAIAGQLARGEISPLQLVFVRWIGVTLIMWPLFGRQVQQYWSVARPRIWRIALMAFIGFSGFNIVFYWASLQTTGVNVGILQGTIPVFVMIGTVLAHGTRIGRIQTVGVIMTVIGIVVVATRGAPLQMLEIAFNPGDLLMLVACLMYAVYALLLKGRPDIPSGAFFTLMAPIAAAISIPPVIVEATLPGYTLPSFDGWLIALYATIFPSCLAQLFFLRGVDLIGPGPAGVYANLVPVFAAVLAVAILGEVFAFYHGFALALVIGGIALAQRKPREPRQDPEDVPG